MKILRALVLPIVVLALAPGCDSKKSAETTNPPGETGAESESASGGEESGGEESGGEESGGEESGGGGGDPAAGGTGVKECDAKIAEVPTALWADRVLVRMPVGVEMVERNEVFAQSSGEAESTCEVMVPRAAMGYFQDDPSKKIKQLRDETMIPLGFEGAPVTWTDENEKGRNFSGAYEVPEDDKGNPPVKGWFVFKESEGTLFWMIMETHPNAFPAIKKSFKASGSSLLIVPAG